MFLAGSICWAITALLTSQTSLLWTNLFLTVVNMVGIWRWLGKRARYDEGARAAPGLFPLSSLEGRPVAAPDRTVIARAVDGMARCDDGRISYLIVSEGGVGGMGERLHALPWSEVNAVEEEMLMTRLSADALREWDEIAPDQWPAKAPAA
jgi:sporulation protein YlmC with PRC-barrel domain